MAKKTVRRTADNRTAKKAAKPPPGSGNGSPATEQPLVTIRAHADGEKPVVHVVKTGAGAVVLNMARRWPYILRVRSRWAGDPDIRDYFAAQSSKDLTKLDVSDDTMQQLALANHIEVEVHAGATGAAPLVEAASEIPWEYLLSAATRNAGRFEALLVTRCISNNIRIRSTRPQQVLFVESAPGRIEQTYEFDDEEARIKAAVNDKMTIAATLPLGKLTTMVKSKKWGAIHVTGVDTHQAAWLVDGFYDVFEKAKPDGKAKVDEKAKPDESPKAGEESERNKDPETDVIDDAGILHDGMILRGDKQSEFPVRYDRLPEILLGAKQKAQVITLNLYYSGARTARELVRKGANAAIGFLDEIDDEFAERFFQAFYWAWCHDGKPIQSAFLNAWKNMDGDRMHGTSIVIWLGSSMAGFEAGRKKTAARPTVKKRSGAR